MFSTPGKRPQYLFLFDRSRAAAVEQIVEYLQRRLRESVAAAASGLTGIEQNFSASETEAATMADRNA
jgi:hypothetical protein